MIKFIEKTIFPPLSVCEVKNKHKMRNKRTRMGTDILIISMKTIKRHNFLDFRATFAKICPLYADGRRIYFRLCSISNVSKHSKRRNIK